MKKCYRVKDTREFKKILDQHHCYSNSVFSLFIGSKQKENARVGLSVSKKRGKAHVRNKIKRQLREMVLKLYTFDENFDTIIIVKNKFLDQSFDENLKSLQSLYQKVKVPK